MSAVLIPAATEAEWLDARRQGVTASEIAVLMGLSPYSSPFALYHQKTGDLPSGFDSERMALGRHLEPYVCDLFAQRHPDLTVTGDGRTLYAHPERPWQMATPDRLVHLWPHPAPHLTDLIEPEAVFDAKTSGSFDGYGEDGSDEIPVHYRCQVLWQMDVVGVTAGYLGCLFLPGGQYRTYELYLGPAEQHDLDIMRVEAQIFLDRIAERRPPPVDWRPATSDALKRLHPSVEDRAVEVGRMPVIRYRAACKAYKAAGQRKKAAENVLRELLGNGRRVVQKGVLVPDRNGVMVPDVVARRDVYEVREHVRKASTTDKLVPVNPPREANQ